MIRKATNKDLPAVVTLLEQADLPAAGITEQPDHLYVLESRGTVVGAVGYEAYPPDALLRSLVIAPAVRGQGYGRQLLSFILKQVELDGIRDAYGLTTTIPTLLSRSGFNELTRVAVPKALLVSEEFRGACPASARLFRISITPQLRHLKEQ